MKGAKQALQWLTFRVIELGSRRARSISSTLSCSATSRPLSRGLHRTYDGEREASAAYAE